MSINVNAKNVVNTSMLGSPSNNVKDGGYTTIAGKVANDYES